MLNDLISDSKWGLFCPPGTVCKQSIDFFYCCIFFIARRVLLWVRDQRYCWTSYNTQDRSLQMFPQHANTQKKELANLKCQHCQGWETRTVISQNSHLAHSYKCQWWLWLLQSLNRTALVRGLFNGPNSLVRNPIWPAATPRCPIPGLISSWVKVWCWCICLIKDRLLIMLELQGRMGEYLTYSASVMGSGTCFLSSFLRQGFP